MIVVDANVLVSCVAGRRTIVAFRDVLARGLALASPLPMLIEARTILIKAIGLDASLTDAALTALQLGMRTLAPSDYALAETAARARLHEGAQKDWPVLAAALSLHGAIWSNDRDFFGVGAAVWSTANIRFA